MNEEVNAELVAKLIGDERVTDFVGAELRIPVGKVLVADSAGFALFDVDDVFVDNDLWVGRDRF